MALKLDITDTKGVKTRYHAVRSFAYEGGKVLVRLFSYVNQATRDSEKAILDQNAKATAYDTNLNTLRSELDGLIGQPDETSLAMVAELSEKVNTLALDTERPQYADVVDTHYGEDEVVIDYFEPLTLEAIYDKLASEGRYFGAEKV